MEKTKEIEFNLQDKSSHKDISQKIINLINQTLSNPGDNFGDRIDYIINKAVSLIDKKLNNISNKEENKLEQRKIFDEISAFLNSFFGELKIKKFYNNIPKVDLPQYSKKNIGNQFVNNVYGKEWKIFYRNEIQGGSCHNRTILFKSIFEVLESKGLDIEWKIFAYDVDLGHSGLIVKFQGKTYLADFGLFNNTLNKVISPVEDLKGLYETKKFKEFSFSKKSDDILHYFDNIPDFVKFINKRKITTATIELKPRLYGGIEKNIRIELAKGYLALIIDGEIKKYSIIKDFSFPKNCKNPHEILDYLLKNIEANKGEKQELKLYLDMIRNKINPSKIHEIFN